MRNVVYGWPLKSIVRAHVERALAWINAAVTTILLGFGVWLIHVANEAAAAAVRTYGYNVDSGALLYYFAIYYCAPTAALLAIVALFMQRRWRGRWPLQAFAVLWVVGSVLSLVFERELRAL